MKLDDLVKKIGAAETAAGMQIKIVAIDGHGGAGKSTLANRLAEELGAEIIHTDDYASDENPLDWWKDLKSELLVSIKGGSKKIKGSIIILEGVSSLRLEFRDYISFGIWVEAPKEVCMTRGLERDGEGARSRWDKWWAEEEEYIKSDKPRDFADIIYNT